MSVSYALRRLAEIIDEVEADGVEVRDMSLPADRAAIADDTVHLTLDVAVSLDGNESAEGEISNGEPERDDRTEEAVITGVVDDPADSVESHPELEQDQANANGENPPEESPDERPTSDAESTDTEDKSSDEDDPEQVVCPEPGCDETFESVPGMKIHRTKIHLRDQSQDESADSTPAYRDPEALRSAYEAHDSFPAMREALDVDVSAQTVRRHMIEHGIHDPDSGDEDESESSDETTDPETESSESTPDEDSAEEDMADDEPDQIETQDDPDRSENQEETDDEDPAIPESAPLADTLPADVTTPADVTFAELKEAVRTADTLYDIQQQFDLERTEARDLLGALDLLELVHGRVATKREREELKAEIDSRIRHNIRGNGTSA